MEDELAVICSSSHRFYGRHSIPLQELEGEAFILREEGSGTRARLETVLRENHISYRPLWDCYSFEAIKEALLHNLGISVMSPRVVKRELATGELWACRLEDISFRRTFDLVCRKGKFFSNTLSRFVEICEGNRNIY